MKKRVFGIFFVMLLSLSLTFLVFAADDVPRLVDEAALFSDSDAEALLGLLDEISERQQMDIVVVTVNSLQGASSMEYADDFYDYNGYGFGEERDGMLFLISMEERDWYISTTGYGITVFTDAGLEYISERFLDDLSEGEYAAAFTTFAELCDDFITQAKTGEPYDVGNLPKEPFWLVGSLAIALAAGFIIALIATGIMRSQLKTVYSRPVADNYIRKGSINITKRSDLFLYRHVSRREKPKDNGSKGPGSSSTHRSSSGSTHGGRGGKF